MRVWALALISLLDYQIASFFKHLKMAAKIAIGETAKRLQFGEAEAVSVPGQRRNYSEAGLFVECPVQPLTSKWNVAAKHAHALRTRCHAK